jgi:hypothetical protein
MASQLPSVPEQSPGVVEQSPSVAEQFRTPAETAVEEFTVSELVSGDAGAHSPFGNIEFPVPYETLFYKHPTPDEKPNFAGGR